MQQRSHHRLSGCITFVAGIFMVSLFLFCAGSQYIDNQLSSAAYLSHLAGQSIWSMPLADVRPLLLKRIPIGTSESDIYAFLEAHGIERDRFVGGQFMRYQPKDNFNTILGLLSDPPYRPTLFCSGGGFIIRFQLDNRDRLKDILIESTSVCL